MHDIRRYIDLVENNIIKFVPAQPSASFDSSKALQSEIARCKRFKTADAYAFSDYNPVHVTNHDAEDSTPMRLRNKEALRMRARWNHLQRSGLLDDEPSPSRFGNRR